jgi:hypothetical protein
MGWGKERILGVSRTEVYIFRTVYIYIYNHIYMTGDMAQAVKCLTSKQEALSSNPNTTKKRRKEKRTR